MDSTPVRAAYTTWPLYNDRLRAVVNSLSARDLGIEPGHGRWPLWATIGHLACQRVFWLCDFAGAPGAETTRFTAAADNCPGDDDLVNVLNAAELVEALDSTFQIVNHCLDTWTAASLAEQIRREWGQHSRVHSRGWALQRVFTHDVSHIAELNEAFARAGLPQVDLWE